MPLPPEPLREDPLPTGPSLGIRAANAPSPASAERPVPVEPTELRPVPTAEFGLNGFATVEAMPFSVIRLLSSFSFRLPASLSILPAVSRNEPRMRLSTSSTMVCRIFSATWMASFANGSLPSPSFRPDTMRRKSMPCDSMSSAPRRRSAAQVASWARSMLKPCPLELFDGVGTICCAVLKIMSSIGWSRV